MHPQLFDRLMVTGTTDFTDHVKKVVAGDIIPNPAKVPDIPAKLPCSLSY